MVWKKDSRYRKEHRCKNKIAHFSAEEAKAAMLSIESNPDTAAVYLCEVCYHYHWGHLRAAS